ncbi:MAG TPA: hypothetical protein DCQ33_16360 [Nitrospira sp.]|nr:hypothetical protein [Nitrospira sp.]
MIHIINPAKKPPRSMCSVGEGAISIDEAVVRHKGEVCIRCMAELFIALRGVDKPVNIAVQRDVFPEAKELGDRFALGSDDRRFVNVCASLIAAAARMWQARNGKPPVGEQQIPQYDEEWFVKVAGWVYRIAAGDINRATN